MTTTMLVAVGLAGVNLLLALVLGAVYLRNHREIRSPFTLGLLLFSAFLVLHNGMIVYTWWTMMETPFSGETFLLVQGALQAAALGTLLASTLR